MVTVSLRSPINDVLGRDMPFGVNVWRISLNWLSEPGYMYIFINVCRRILHEGVGEVHCKY
jgi:hypothetical protein